MQWALLSLALLAVPAAAQTLTGSVMTGPTYVWEPQIDITAHELALVMPIFLQLATCRNVLGCGVIPILERLPPEAKRHFRQTTP